MGEEPPPQVPLSENSRAMVYGWKLRPGVVLENVTLEMLGRSRHRSDGDQPDEPMRESVGMLYHETGMSWNLSAVESECGSMVAMRQMAHGWMGRGIGVLLLLGSGGLVPAASDASPGLRARLAEDGRSFCVTAPGLIDFQAHWSVNINRAGKPLILTSATGTVATGMVTAIRYPESGVEILFRLETSPGDAGVMAQAGIRNLGKTPVNLLSVTPLVAESFQVVGDPAEWLVTRLDTTAMIAAPVTSLATIDGALDVYEYGGFYRRDGTGFLFGPVGTPVAYVHTRFWHRQDNANRATIKIEADMSRVQVDPGETRWGQQVVLLMEPPRQALAHWADWVAQSHGARAGKEALSGWSSWGLLGPSVTGTDVLAVAEAASKSTDRLRPAVIQIDDGYQDTTGQAETNDKFPEGLAFWAQRIAATGARPGLFLDLVDNPARPYSTVDRAQRVQDSVHKGFTYLKILYRQLGQGSGGKRTCFEINRDNLAAIRQAAGENSYLLSSNGDPDRAHVGAVDASRTGRNVYRNAIRQRIDDVLRSYHLHDRWFVVDNDNYFMGTDIANVSQVEGGWPLVRTWMSMVGLSCGSAITSDPWQWESFRPYWRNVEVMTPPAKERTAVLDLCTSEDWPRLVGHVHRDGGDFAVALLWNPATKEQAIKLDFAQAGLDPHSRYAVWSFWDNQFFGVAEGSWTTPRLAPSASQHLRFTDLVPARGRPLLIGSNLHIYCGAAEIQRVQTSRAAMTVELTDAGARDGDLFVYSRYQPVLKTATGCAVTGIGSAGENAWRISLRDRQRGAPQRIELAIILPVMQQGWFWMLIATVIASLLFGAWRYVVGLRLERAHALERERARIAQDLHDDLGTSLTRIAAMADTGTGESDDAGKSQSGFVAIRDVANDMTRALDEIVWTVNPVRDSLDSLATYFGSYAQQVLTEAGLRCRLQMPLELPAWRLSAETRHNLLLAYKEALHNVLKHAHATEVTVGLTVTATGFVLFVEDNGRGLPTGTEGPAARTGNGLQNMRNRLAHLKGNCRVLNRAEGGTRVEFEVPAAAGR